MKTRKWSATIEELRMAKLTGLKEREDIVSLNYLGCRECIQWVARADAISCTWCRPDGGHRRAAKPSPSRIAVPAMARDEVRLLLIRSRHHVKMRLIPAQSVPHPDPAVMITAQNRGM